MRPLLRQNLELFGVLAPVESSQSAIKNVAITFSHPQANREVLLGQVHVRYLLSRAKRRTIGLVVGPDGLAVRAPRWTTLAEVDAVVREKADWVVRKLQESQQRQMRQAHAQVVWQDGATLPFLGETIRLCVQSHDAQTHPSPVANPLLAAGVADGWAAGSARASCATLPQRRSTRTPLHSVQLDPLGDPSNPSAGPHDGPAAPRCLRVSLPPGASAQQLRDAVQAWLMSEAQALFTQRLDHFAERLGVRWTRLRLSQARTRWGSAKADGSIRLNWRLIHLRLPIIDYVVAHELSHLRVMDHSPRFWDTVASVVPDYAILRTQLKDDAVPVL
jgi:predicted metal-dependent hydrolase